VFNKLTYDNKLTAYPRSEPFWPHNYLQFPKAPIIPGKPGST